MTSGHRTLLQELKELILLEVHENIGTCLPAMKINVFVILFRNIEIFKHLRDRTRRYYRQEGN
jgi:hypothetical protein